MKSHGGLAEYHVSSGADTYLMMRVHYSIYAADADVVM